MTATNEIFVDTIDKRWRRNAGEFDYKTTCRTYRLNDEKLDDGNDERRERLRWNGGGGGGEKR